MMSQKALHAKRLAQNRFDTTIMQNRRQKIFNRRASCLCEWLDIIKTDKPPLIYSVSSFKLGSLEPYFGRSNPPKAPGATGLL